MQSDHDSKSPTDHTYKYLIQYNTTIKNDILPTTKNYIYVHG